MTETDQRDRAASSQRCPNCDAPRSGTYCVACGQNNRADRLSVVEMFGTFFEHMLELDVPIVRTVVGLTLRPGPTCLAYIRGQRRRYSNPFRYCLITAAIYVVVMTFLDISTSSLIAQNTTQSAATNARGASRSLGEEMGERLSDYVSTAAPQMIERNLNILAFFAIPLACVVFMLLFRGRRRTYAEHLVFALFVFGHGFLYTTPLVVLGIMKSVYGIWASMLIDTVYLTWAGTRFYGTGVVTTFLRMVVAYLGYLVATSLLGIVWVLYWLLWIAATGEIWDRI